MGYRLLDLELSEPIAPVQLAADQDGLGLLARWKGRPVGFELDQQTAAALISAADLQARAERYFAGNVLAARLEEVFGAAPAPPWPSLTIAICSRNRADRLARLLRSLVQVVEDAAFAEVEMLVIDNGSTDHTAEVVRGFPGVRHVLEAKAGLDFARNRALAEAGGKMIAYLDDDVVVDSGWLRGLALAWSSRTDAGGFTGLVLPYRLDTEAQLMFEQRGGFRRGFDRIEFRSAHYHNRLFPAGAGSVGAGCNMAFDRGLLLELGGFDEALDTGQPLPGGGDLDIFYRVLRAGRAIVYEPRFAVHHEHRETLAELKRQYWSWGLGLMAFLCKSSRTDPEMRNRHRAMIAWWFGDQGRSLFRSLRRFNLHAAGFALAELRGGIRGIAGEYDRSRARVQRIRESVA